MLLGYGRANAMLFHTQERALLNPIFSEEMDRLFSSPKVALNFTLGWPHIGTREALLFPSFMADVQTEETQRLKQDYMHTRETILNYYEDKNFLEATLQLLLPAGV